MKKRGVRLGLSRGSAGRCRSGVSAPLSQGFMSLFLCPWHLLRGRDGRGRMLWSRCQQQRRAPGGHQLTATCRRSILIQTARSRACFQNPSPQSPGLLAGAPGEHQAHSRQVPVGQGHVLAASPTSPCLHQVEDKWQSSHLALHLGTSTFVRRGRTGRTGGELVVHPPYPSVTQAWRLQLQIHAEKGQMWATCLWGSPFVHGKLPGHGSGGGCSGGISRGIHPLQPAAAVAEAHHQPPDRVLVSPPAPQAQVWPRWLPFTPPSFVRATPAKPPEEDRGRTVMLPGTWRLCGDHGTQTPVRTLRFLVSPQ